MREKILRALRESEDEYISGSTLCEQLGVSRQAVWKNITALKENGYDIESVPNKGYHLIRSSDRIYAPDILSRFPKGCLCQKVECFEQIDSTNTKAKQLAELGESEGTLVMAEEQTGGKGRRGRKWQSETGVGIWMSLLLKPQILPSKVSGLTLLTALAVARGIEEICHIKPQIKWPNDVVIAKKKICGILTEMSSEENFIHYVVVGIGINANTKKLPKEIEEIATSIYQQTGKKVNRCELTAKIISIVCDYYKRYVKDGDLSGFVEEYNSCLANKDQEVRVYYGMVENATEEKTDQGIARGIDKDGALFVEIGQELKKIVSGEVSVRGLYGYV